MLVAPSEPNQFLRGGMSVPGGTLYSVVLPRPCGRRCRRPFRGHHRSTRGSPPAARTAPSSTGERMAPNQSTGLNGVALDDPYRAPSDGGGRQPDPGRAVAGMTVIRRNGSTAAVRLGPRRGRHHQSLHRGRGRLGRHLVAAARARRRAHRAGDSRRSARRHGAERHVDLEDVQDQVELALMRGGHAKVARSYILYREEHRKAREERLRADGTAQVPTARGAAGAQRRRARRHLQPARHRPAARHHRRGLRGSGRRQRRHRLHRDDLQPLRRDQHQGARAGADHGGPRARRDRTELLLRRRPAARRHPAHGGADLPGRHARPRSAPPR